MFRKKAVAVAVLFVTGGALLASSAGATEPDDPIDRITVDKAVTTERTFVIDGVEYTLDVGANLKPGPVTIQTDAGNIEANLTSRGEVETTSDSAPTKAVVPLAGCSWRNWVAPALSSWINSVDGCSFIGLNESVKYAYGMRVANGSGGCFQGRGYDLQYIGGGRYQRVTTWTSFGCKSRLSDTTGVVHWGEVASNAKMKYKPTGIIGASGTWK